ncbi:hypothetical protein [Fulvivirga sedimenti]|uniref:Lipoprotein n=1 Tax=Fulvivirga sedimenti TaxID=2879465 RepID=A0A9X1HQ26_9BACT|nr:hypothetical protein [Fulvivirga sedimenti]MCA6074699.1 hypothetical protein [Fulvivirga sedimenti]MCA6075876.1 hypothetical protein [Fulvivirga sedimenti]MCA6077004.1 hypothetical protein [Fulvivirga sedimenti]
MKKSVNHTFRLIAILLTATYFTACNNDEDAVQADTSAEDLEIVSEASFTNTLADEDLEMVELVTEASISGGKTSNHHLPECAVVTRDAENQQVIIDFGEECIGPFGRTRSGKIIISYGGEFNDQMANRVISFDNYVVNNRQISGTIELRNFNRSEEGFLTATRALVGYTVTYPDGNSVTVNGSTLREWIEGEGDGDPLTNVIRITGGYEGTSTRGVRFTHTITEPVIARFACRAQGGFLRTAGIIEMIRKNENFSKERIRTILYGDDICDNTITVIINGREFTITEE